MSFDSSSSERSPALKAIEGPGKFVIYGAHSKEKVAENETAIFLPKGSFAFYHEGEEYAPTVYDLTEDSFTEHDDSVEIIDPPADQDSVNEALKACETAKAAGKMQSKEILGLSKKLLKAKLEQLEKSVESVVKKETKSAKPAANKGNKATKPAADKKVKDTEQAARNNDESGKPKRISKRSTKGVNKGAF